MTNENGLAHAPGASDDIRQQLQTLENLRPFPATATKILSECEKQDADVRLVSQLIECEPAVSTKVLCLANSPLYGATRPITTISHALVALGFRTVSQMALVVAAGELFSQGDEAVAQHRQKTFQQSLACGTAARVIAIETGMSNPDEAFLGGVMHDIGKLAFFDVIPQDYVKVLEQFRNGESIAYEFDKFGVEHASVGKNCGLRWGLPTQINNAIRNHHLPVSEVSDDLSRTILAANYFARQWEIGFEECERVEKNDLLENLLVGDVAESAKSECKDQFDALNDIYGV